MPQCAYSPNVGVARGRCRTENWGCTVHSYAHYRQLAIVLREISARQMTAEGQAEFTRLAEQHERLARRQGGWADVSEQISVGVNKRKVPTTNS